MKHFLGLTLYILPAIVFVLVSAKRENVLEIEKETLDAILNTTVYDASIRPYGANGTGPVEVRINMYIRSISEIDDVNMEYSTQLTFRQEWKDFRLRYDDRKGRLKYLTLIDSHRIWRPDIFFSNEKSGHFHDILTPNVLIRIKPDGSVLYSIRISLKLACPMNLRYYPMDKQTCYIKMASYGYTTEDLKFLWKDGNPVQLTTRLNLPSFSLDGVDVDYCTSKTTTGEYSCLQTNLYFSRDLNYYLLQVYIPFMFLVMLSWLSFWLDHRATTARVAIWVTIMLTITIISTSLQSKLPAVSYTKAIDIWIGVCMTFLFAALIELALITQATVADETLRNQTSNEDGAMIKQHMLSVDDRAGGGTGDSKFGFLNRWLKNYSSKAQKIDAISRILFPLAFVFFNIVYWATYYRGSTVIM